MLIKKRNTSIEYYPCTSSWGIPAGLNKPGQKKQSSLRPAGLSDPEPSRRGVGVRSGIRVLSLTRWKDPKHFSILSYGPPGNIYV